MKIEHHTATEPTAAPAHRPTPLADYLSLTKPRVVALLLLTTLAAMLITSEGLPSPGLIVWTLLGGYLAAGGAGAINCAFDGDIDSLMGRTSRRPVPGGRISRRRAFWFGALLSALAVIVLAVFTTWLAAALALVGIIYYALVYTCLLKRHTWHNVVIGGGAGAVPPLVGWAAVTGTLELPALALFLIIFCWSPPHFWALALMRRRDYARASVPMLPVVAGEGETHRQILVYSVLTVLATLLLPLAGAMGLLYLLLALLLGAGLIYVAWKVWRVGGQVHTWRLFRYTLVYLALLFCAMVLDRLLV